MENLSHLASSSRPFLKQKIFSDIQKAKIIICANTFSIYDPGQFLQYWFFFCKILSPSTTVGGWSSSFVMDAKRFLRNHREDVSCSCNYPVLLLLFCMEHVMFSKFSCDLRSNVKVLKKKKIHAVILSTHKVHTRLSFANDTKRTMEDRTERQIFHLQFLYIGRHKHLERMLRNISVAVLRQNVVFFMLS